MDNQTVIRPENMLAEDILKDHKQVLLGAAYEGIKIITGRDNISQSEIDKTLAVITYNDPGEHGKYADVVWGTEKEHTHLLRVHAPQFKKIRGNKVKITQKIDQIWKKKHKKGIICG